jgi:hypothetical protein
MEPFGEAALSSQEAGTTGSRMADGRVSSWHTACRAVCSVVAVASGSPLPGLRA